jgi:hypothetical protein
MPMPESPPSRGRAATQRSAGAARDQGRATGAPQIQVSYYRRMRPNRVYPFVVSWKGGARSATPVTVRLVMAGTQVVPAEQVLDPNEDRATFYVTPLARGWMRGERLEVLQDGRKVQELRLPCKATTQRATWLLLLLTLLVGYYITPLFIYPIHEPMPPRSGDTFEEQPVQHYPPRDAMRVRLTRLLPPVLPVVREYLPDVAKELDELPDKVGASYAYLYYTEKNNNIPIGEGLLALMIVLTLLSWFTHLERRKRRVGKALPVGGAAEAV